MRGVSRFDFYPKNWIGDTRGLSPEARGIYIDLLCLIYSTGGPIAYAKGQDSEAELVSTCALKRATSLRRILDELIAKGKLRLIDGHLLNGRAHEELEKIARRRGDEPACKPADNDDKAGCLRPASQPENPSNQQVTQTVLPDSERPEEESKTPSTESRSSAKAKGSKNDLGGGSRATRVERKMSPDQRKRFIDQVAAKEIGPNGYIIVDLANRGDAGAIAACKAAAARHVNGKGKPVVWLRTVPGAAPYDTSGPPLAEQPDYVPHMPERPPRRANGEVRP